MRYTGQAKRSGKPLYGIWKGIKSRCYNPNRKAYPYYGARGIRVCAEWLHNYPAFEAWALVNGYASHLEIDRRDNGLGYSPENCRFTTAKVQSRNRRNNLLVTAFGETKTIMEWSEDRRCSIGYPGLRMRFLSTPKPDPEQAIARGSMKSGLICYKGHTLASYKGRKRCPACMREYNQRKHRSKMKLSQQFPPPN